MDRYKIEVTFYHEICQDEPEPFIEDFDCLDIFDVLGYVDEVYIPKFIDNPLVKQIVVYDCINDNYPIIDLFF